MATSNGPNIGRLIDAALGDSYYNEFTAFLRAFDCLVQASVIDKDLAGPPNSPANGDRYIIAANPTGAWANRAGQIARWYTSVAVPAGAWEFMSPSKGWQVVVNDELDTSNQPVTYIHNGTAWVLKSSGAGAVTSVAGRTGNVTLTKDDVQLPNVNNTSDANKPVSTAQQTALNAKQDSLIPGAWTNLTLINGWATDDGTPQRARVRRIGPFGQIELVIQHPAGNTTLSPFNLPSGFIPASAVGLQGTDFYTNAFRNLIVTSAGAAITNGFSINEFQTFGVIYYIG